MDSRQRKSLTFIIVDYLITECTCESDRDRNSVRVSHWREDKKRSKTIPRMERFSPLRLVWAEVIVKHDWACSNLARRLKKRSTIFKPGRFCFVRLRGEGGGEGLAGRGPRTATKITHNNLLIILQLLRTTWLNQWRNMKSYCWIYLQNPNFPQSRHKVKNS